MTTEESFLSDLLDRVIAIAQAAGVIALRYLPNSGEMKGVEWKSDNTPVTLADREMDRLIGERLAALVAGIPIISEETANSEWQQRRNWQRVWVVDPLDGTKHFIAGNKDYSVNIALIEQGTPRLSVVFAPSHDLCYYAVRGQGAYKKTQQGDIQLHCQQQESEPVRVLISHGVPGWKLRSHLQRYEHYQLVRLGSSLKQCWIAEGRADVYPRFGKTSEWDTAAAQLILEEAGGSIVDIEGNSLIYNKPNLGNPEFIAHAPWYQIATPWYMAP